MATLRTIGYERASLADFLATLRAARVDHIIDVRAVPVSRKPGFSQAALRQTLAENGIGYVHIRALGTPPAGREAARAGRYRDFERIFLAHLASPEASEGLAAAVAQALTRRACLLCFERDAERCHRNLIARRLQSEHRFRVEHLAVAEHATAGGHERDAGRGAHSREGGAAAEPAAR